MLHSPVAAWASGERKRRRKQSNRWMEKNRDIILLDRSKGHSFGSSCGESMNCSLEICQSVHEISVCGGSSFVITDCGSELLKGLAKHGSVALE